MAFADGYLRQAAEQHCARSALAAHPEGYDRERMQIGDPVERFMIFLQRYPLTESTKEVTEME